ncbi:hypothetical protein PLEOSDRAFT_1065310 [Pleurotus ostreatus PC15]|uniref:Ubiquinol-cytochrome c chaperone domain-containing protein n=1 Tax=Pleurotus ostreatus (strain PC15) TaxID=1137138 RepID=A0A067NWJ1_PLEO1|nr:hypothetical protein PLEOSDRAFT_1065310 [Pleurotus ostreatus PC15]
MISRSALRVLATRQCVRRLATQPPKITLAASAPPTSPPPSTPPERQKAWLTRKLQGSPAALSVLRGLGRILGYGSPEQIAGRRTFVLYKQLCAVRPDEESAFWQNDCYLPPTFQSWFTITNLHVWLLTARLRALPQPHGKACVQGLLDHFFIDIEDRIRAVLQPRLQPPTPYTFKSDFYTNPNAPPLPDPNSKTRQKAPSRAPDRIVMRQMKIFKEQWQGMGLALDLGLVKGDEELAAAMWRNLLGARGARGISLESSKAQFRRTVNLVGGEVVNVSKVDFEKEETQDDGSGVHDFPPQESDKYVKYPELMLDLVGYARRELSRLEAITDEELMKADPSRLRFGPVKTKA